MQQSPKTRFLLDQPAVSQHLELTVKDSFLHALDMAMLELVHNIGCPVAADAVANGYRIEGAKEYRRILENLAEVKKTSQLTPSLPPQLNHNA